MSQKDCKCSSARNFKSQLGKKVADNVVWKEVNCTFKKNKDSIKATGAALNSASNAAEYAAAKNTADALKPVQDGFRLLVTQPDGSVTYDSSKGDANTYANAQAGTINENHNTRMSIMSAQLTCDGRGNEIKQSTSTGQTEAYQAQTIKDLYGANKGTVRLSKKSA